MRRAPPALALPLLLAACADAGGVGYQGRSLSDAAQWFGGAFQRAQDSAYSAGARTGERLGTAPPAETPRAGVFVPRQGSF